MRITKKPCLKTDPIGLMKLIQWMLVIAGLLVMLGGLGGGISAWHWWQSPIGQKQMYEQVRVNIQPGYSAHRVARLLAEEGLLQQPKWFAWWLGWQNKAQHIRAGEYDINPLWTPAELRDALMKGSNVRHAFKIVPGETLSQIRQRIVQLDNIKQTIAEDEWQRLGERWPSLGVTSFLEGWLLPETYFYHSGEADWQIIERALVAMVTSLEQAWSLANGAENLPLKSPYETLILASIIEKETGVAHERSMISGVFVRRLQKNMRLQTDPTVIYGMGEAYQGHIGRAGLDTPTPYNTYLVRGLPPTPIAMPSAEAINAALHPDEGDYLFFVAKGGGEHHFSVTLEEHNKAVRRYILKRN